MPSCTSDISMVQVLEAAGFGYWLFLLAVQGWGCLLVSYGFKFKSGADGTHSWWRTKLSHVMVWVGQELVIASDHRLADTFLPTFMGVAVAWHSYLPH